jgi:predicted RNase H-like HicB family nuclease
MTQGDDPDDSIANLREALRGYIKTVGIKQAFKEYRKLIRETVEVPVK